MYLGIFRAYATRRELLINTLDDCLQNAEKISTAHEFLALMKSIDGMAFMHVFASERIKLYFAAEKRKLFCVNKNDNFLSVFYF